MGNPQPAVDGVSGSLAGTSLSPRRFRDTSQADKAHAMRASLGVNTSCDDRQHPATACTTLRNTRVRLFVAEHGCNGCNELFSSLSALSPSSARSAHCNP
jgi:hypothetical protein